jgi:hypothetical protein
VSGSCKECGAASDCAAGYAACTNNSCVCRAPSGANLLPNPGFDGSGQPWAPVSMYSGGNDADACVESGSVGLLGISDQVSQCLSAAAGADYFITFRFKSTAGGTGYCGVNFYSGANCNGSTLENSFEASVSGPAGTWRQAVATTGKASSNAVSLSFYCAAALGFGYYDQLYLGRSSATF